MIDLFIFDMGGVIIRNYNVAQKLSKYLVSDIDIIHNYDKNASEALFRHSEGKITEEQFWKEFSESTNIKIPEYKNTLLGKFFTPTLDESTINIIKELKNKGKRVVCGTNVIDSHYNIHQKLKQYDIFDKVYASNLMHIAKPKVEFFKQICKEENVEFDKVFFTDDVQKNVDSALSCGIKAFLYTDAIQLKKQLDSLE